MSKYLASAANSGRLNNIQDSNARLDRQPDVSAENGEGKRFRGDGQTGHSLAVREALGSYALAMGIESGLERARDAIVRQLGEARTESHHAWQMLNRALQEEASADEEVEG